MTQDLLPYRVATFYKFVHLPDYQALRPVIAEVCRQNQIKGTILLAAEGVNSTIAGPREGVDALFAFLHSDPRLCDLTAKFSDSAEMPFLRMKVRLKKEIVTMGVPTVSPENSVGTYIKPQDWNALIQDPDVLLVDTRNIYEMKVGKFKGAIDPEIETFRAWPEFVQQQLAAHKKRKIATYCTGGIRCEKATSYMRDQGFEHVYHLEGGILKYLEEVPESESLWEGECFVFDRRVAVTHNVQQGSYDLCFACRMPLDAADKQSPDYIAGISCPHCVETRTADQRKAASERMRQMELARKRGCDHMGPSQDFKTYDA